MKARVRTAALLIATLLSTVFVVTGGSAATPPSGTMSLDEPSLQFEGNAITPAYPPTNLGLVGPVDGCPPQAADPEDVACGHFTVTVDVPEGHWEDNFGFLVITISFAHGDDWEVAVYEGTEPSPVYDYGAATASNPERVVVPNPVGAYEIRIVPYAVTSLDGYVGDLQLVSIPKAEVEEEIAPGFQAFHGTPQTTTPADDFDNEETTWDGKPLQFFHNAIGHGALEPTIGVDPEGNAYIAALGFQSDELYTTIQKSTDGGANWVDVAPDFAVPNSNDPYVYVDPVNGWIFDVDLQALTQSSMLISSNGGESWLPGGPQPTGIVVDHQTITSGPIPEGSGLVSLNPDFGDRVVYYCFNRVAESVCERSLDGGTTWARTGSPAFPGVDLENYGTSLCGGLHGHAAVDPEGRLLLPKGHCGQPWIGVSEDGGTTWTTTRVSDIEFPEQQASVEADAAGNLYYAFYDTNGLPYLSISTDHGATWGDAIMIAPPGVTEVQWPTVHAGSEGRVAVGFPCTRAQGQYKSSLTRAWDYCVVASVDALDDNPTFLSNIANDPRDPIHRGECPGRCGNMYDFLDLVVAPESGGGEIWAVYTDTCTDLELEDFPQCNTDPLAIGFDGSNDNASADEAGVAVRQVCGPSMWESIGELTESCTVASGDEPQPAPEPQPDPEPNTSALPTTGGGLAAAGVAALAGVLAARRRREDD